MNGTPSVAHNCLQLTGGVERELARLDHARPCDQKQRAVEPRFEVAQFHGSESRKVAANAHTCFAWGARPDRCEAHVRWPDRTVRKLRVRGAQPSLCEFLRRAAGTDAGSDDVGEPSLRQDSSALDSPARTASSGLWHGWRQRLLAPRSLIDRPRG